MNIPSTIDIPEFYVGHDASIRKWRLSENERPRRSDGELSGNCYDCAMPYEFAGDCSIPSEVWEIIKPVDNQGAGILCPSCILQRLHVVNISGVPATLW